MAIAVQLREEAHGINPGSKSGLKTFSIKELEELCEVKAHTIRIWETRYGVPLPGRHSSGNRFYSIDELEKTLQICLLTRYGYKISKLVDLSNEELCQKAGKLFQLEAQEEMVINDLIVCMYRMNIECFESMLDKCFGQWKVEDVIHRIIFPFLQKAGLLFEGKKLIEEHLVVTIVRKKLLNSIERLQNRDNSGSRCVLFLCGVQQLDLFLLYAYFRLKANGHQVLYFGNDVTLKNLVEINSMYKPAYLLTYQPKKHPVPLNSYLELMKNGPTEARLILANPDHSEKLSLSNENIDDVYYENVWSYFDKQQNGITMISKTFQPIHP